MVCVYRAVTQSFVHDEALTYQLYLSRPAAEMFHVFSANHHFLNTLLMYACASVFGFSEWSLRIPALAGAALYFAAVYCISRHAFGAGNTFLLAVALLTLHPFILDFMVAARGYGMALGFLMWALALMLETPTPRRLAVTAISLSLSAMGSLVFVLPAAILAGFLVWRFRKSPATWTYFVAPILAMALLFALISPLRSATPDRFYAGAPSLQETLRRLARVTVAHRREWREAPYFPWARDSVALFLGPAILLVGLATQIVRRNVLVLLSSVTVVGSALMLWMLHLFFNVLYPEDRTAIYFIPLTLLTLIGLAGDSPRRFRPVVYVLSITLLIIFVGQWNVRMFFVWYYDADTREIVQRIAAERGANSVRISSSWPLEPSLNFYRETNHWTWIQPVTRVPLSPGYDYYAIVEEDRAAIEALGLKALFRGEPSGTVLAVPMR